MTAVIEWFQGFANTCIVVGWLCVVAGFFIYGLADVALALIARHS